MSGFEEEKKQRDTAGMILNVNVNVGQHNIQCQIVLTKQKQAETNRNVLPSQTCKLDTETLVSSVGYT